MCIIDNIMFKAIPTHRKHSEIKLIEKMLYNKNQCKQYLNLISYDDIDKIKELIDLNNPTIDDLDDFCKRNICKQINNLEYYSYYSLILYTITKKCLLSKNILNTILQTLAGVLTYYKLAGGKFKWRLNFYWLDAMILNGYKLSSLEKIALKEIGYVKSYLLQDFKHITVTDLEMLFTASNIINDIVSDNKTKIDAIIDLVKSSGHKITNRCILLAIKTGLSLCDQQICDFAWIHRDVVDMQKFKPIIYTFFNRLFNFFELLNYKYTCTFTFERILKMVFEKKINFFCNDLNNIILRCVIEYFESKQMPIKACHICNNYRTLKFGFEYLVSKCDPSKDTFTDNDIKCLLTKSVINFDAIKIFQQKFNCKFSQEIFEHSFRTNNKYLLDFVCSQQTFDCTPCCIKYAFEYRNYDMIQYLLEQKITPSDKNIESLCISTNISNIVKIIKLLHIYGISMSEKTKQLIVLTIGESFDSFNMKPHIFNRLKSIYDPLLPRSTYRIKTKGIHKLRSMFCNENIETIQYYIKINSIVPDIYCFENAVMYQNFNAIMYAVQEYGYIPTIPIIMKCQNFNVRIALLNKFYPHMMVFNYLSNKKTNESKVKESKKVSNTTLLIDSDINPVIEPTNNMSPKLTIEHKTHIMPDEIDERPIKKISKKLTTNSASSDTMFVSFD